MSQLLRQKPTAPRFRINMSAENAAICLASAIAAEVKSRGWSLSDSAELQEKVELVAKWMTTDTPRHSLLLSGNCGNGKTTFLTAMQNLINHFDLRDPLTNRRMRMPIFNAVSLAEVRRTDPKEWHDIAHREIIAIDDIGTESRELMVYGNMTAPMAELLEERYSHSLPTIITSNLTPPDISKAYGPRIADRMREIMEVVAFSNESYRALAQAAKSAGQQ